MTPEQWAAGVGLVMPILVAIVNRPEWNSWVKAVVALVASIAGGTITALLAGQFTGASWFTSVGIVFGVSQGFYHTWFKGSDINNFIEQRINLLFGMKTIEGSSAPAEDSTPGDSGGVSS